MAFFPLFPALGAIVHWVTGLAVPMSLWLVALLASVVAAAGIFRCVSLWGGESIAWLSVVLWGLAPHSLVVVMPYTEGLFTALAAWALVAMTRQRWWWAAGLVALACLTRPTGWVLIVVLVWAVYRASGQSGWRWLTVVFAGAVGVSFPFYVAWRVGQWDGYLQVQRQWHSHGQWPWLGIAEAWGQLSGGGVGPDARWIGAWVLLVVLVVGGWLADRSLRGNTGADLLWLYTAGVVGLALMAGGYPWSRGRFLLPAFGIYAVLAAWLCRLPWAVRAVVLVALSLGSLAWTVVVANGSVSP